MFLQIHYYLYLHHYCIIITSLLPHFAIFQIHDNGFISTDYCIGLFHYYIIITHYVIISPYYLLLRGRLADALYLSLSVLNSTPSLPPSLPTSVYLYLILSQSLPPL